MEKIEKKSFSILNIEDEVAYCETMASQSWRLTKVDEEGYHFSELKVGEDVDYVIEFFQNREKEDREFYLNQGFVLVSEYRATKGTWFYYYRPHQDTPIQYRKDDRIVSLLNIKRRLEVFWSIVSASLLVFSIYITYMTRNMTFFILLAVSLFFSIYLWFLWRKLTKLTKIS